MTCSEFVRINEGMEVGIFNDVAACWIAENGTSIAVFLDQVRHKDSMRSPRWKTAYGVFYLEPDRAVALAHRLLELARELEGA